MSILPEIEDLEIYDGYDRKPFDFFPWRIKCKYKYKASVLTTVSVVCKTVYGYACSEFSSVFKLNWIWVLLGSYQTRTSVVGNLVVQD